MKEDTQEKEYIYVSNRARVNAALSIMREVMGGDGYGMTENEVNGIKKLLFDAQKKLLYRDMED